MKKSTLFISIALFWGTSCGPAFADGQLNDCNTSQKYLDTLIDSQIDKISEYNLCLQREGAQKIVSNYAGFVCDFQARQAQRGQLKISFAAKDAHRACEVQTGRTQLISTSGHPYSILPAEFVATTIAKRALTVSGAHDARSK